MSYELIITCVPESQCKDTMQHSCQCREMKGVKENGRIMSGKRYTKKWMHQRHIHSISFNFQHPMPDSPESQVVQNTCPHTPRPEAIMGFAKLPVHRISSGLSRPATRTARNCIPRLPDS